MCYIGFMQNNPSQPKSSTSKLGVIGKWAGKFITNVGVNVVASWILKAGLAKFGLSF
jgi:hypothetical protein